MSNLFDISVSALEAFQTAISVAQNNIANYNTPGYAVESANLTNVAPQYLGGTAIGAGVDVASVTRSINQLSNNQLNSSQSSLGSLDSLQTVTTQIDNIVGATAGGLTTALQSYYSAWSTVANNPTSSASRQALIGQAQSVAASFTNTSAQLQGLNTTINSGISTDVGQINSLSASIATLNTEIANSAGTAANGQPPNGLLDQRDAALSSLSKLVGVTTTTDSNGGLNVFVANGQPLVLQGTTNSLTTVPNQFNAAQLEISTAASGSKSNLSAQITTGDLGGLLAARTQAVDPALNQLGQIATAFSASANTQQASGLDLTGKVGANMFSVGAPQATASSNNSDATTVSAAVTVTGIGALTSNDYILSYTNATPTLTNAATGTVVTSAGLGTAASPLTADGLSIVTSSPPASGDKFLIQPTATAASSFAVAITSAAQIAAAGAVKTSAGSSAGSINTGTATISSGTVVDPTNAALFTTAQIVFGAGTPPTTYTVSPPGTPTGTGNYTSGGNIAVNGWQVQITGAPVAGDTFTVQSNAGGATGDNRNALASASQQTTPVLAGGTLSINGAASALVTTIGSQAEQVNTAQAAQTSVNTQASANVQSVSGVNLDEEAANLVQWQQAYQASAQALAIGNATFTTLLSAINSG